jgi:predicted MPP superfamily phosphohydrolase
MRNIQFLIFFSIVISVYSLLSYYIYSKGIQAFPPGAAGRSWFRGLFIFLTASYVVARVMERVYLSVMSDVFTWIGSFWLAAFFYFLLIAMAIDLVRLVNAIIPFIPDAWKTLQFKQTALMISGAVVSVLLLAGFINALSPRLKTIDININKEIAGPKELKIAFVSDIHMGTLVGPRRTKKIVDRLNALGPDLILLGGDIVDEDLGPVIRGNLGASLTQLKAPLGVIGITGNHEYIGGAVEAVRYLEEHGITMIRDTFMVLRDEVYLVGREDRDKPRFAGKNRKAVEEVIAGVDLNKPVIMLDHQPFDLDDKEKAGIDLTLSGHTHHGQIWPLNYLTKAIYEVSWGYKQKGKMHVYVSSGVGGWGPPVRLGNRPEIVLLKLKFD